MKNLLLIIVAVVLMAASCKKNNPKPVDPEPTPQQPVKELVILKFYGPCLTSRLGNTQFAPKFELYLSGKLTYSVQSVQTQTPGLLNFSNQTPGVIEQNVTTGDSIFFNVIAGPFTSSIAPSSSDGYMLYHAPEITRRKQVSDKPTLAMPKLPADTVKILKWGTFYNGNKTPGWYYFKSIKFVLN